MNKGNSFEYYLDLIEKGATLTEREMVNAKELFRRGYYGSLDASSAVVLRNRYELEDWNDWFYEKNQKKGTGR